MPTEGAPIHPLPDVPGTAAAEGGERVGVGARVSLHGVGKRYADVVAVEDLTLEISPGELVTLLGPSGSGKTTTLMMVAGFTEPSAGDLLINGRPVVHLPPHRRNVGVVFQHYALFPHMTVAENIAFPLRMRGARAADIRERVASALDLVQMPGLGHRFPGQLSGGQQQRVAFARAIVFDPPVLLLDEPLGALDKKLREAMQVELKALHAKLGVTMIYVTHDQSEALVLSDRVAVMNLGRLEQVGSPQDLYERPETAFVADFVGESNTLRGTVERVDGESASIVSSGGLHLTASMPAGVATGADVRIMVRPERVFIGDEAEGFTNQFRGAIKDVSYIGDSSRYQIALSAEEVVTASVHNRGIASLSVEAGHKVRVGFRPSDLMVFSTTDGT